MRRNLSVVLIFISLIAKVGKHISYNYWIFLLLILRNVCSVHFPSIDYFIWFFFFDVKFFPVLYMLWLLILCQENVAGKDFISFFRWSLNSVDWFLCWVACFLKFDIVLPVNVFYYFPSYFRYVNTLYVMFSSSSLKNLGSYPWIFLSILCWYLHRIRDRNLASFFTCGYPVFQALFVKKTMFSLILIVGSFVKNHMADFWVFHSFLLTYMFILCQNLAIFVAMTL